MNVSKSDILEEILDKRKVREKKPGYGEQESKSPAVLQQGFLRELILKTRFLSGAYMASPAACCCG